MVRKVLVIGYYNRQNLGDDVFEYVFKKYFDTTWPKNKYTIVNIDDLKTIEEDISAVIFGGGDLVNDYFIRKLRPFIENKTCPFYAISIGIPYPQLIDAGYLDRFDYIIHRNKTDKGLLSTKYTFRSKWYPDLTSLLFFDKDIRPVSLSPMLLENNPKSKKIGICLSRHIYNSKNVDAYNRMVSEYVKFFRQLANIKYTYRGMCGYITIPRYELYFIPFCTDNKINHDDRLLHRDIYQYIEYDNVHYIDKAVNIESIITLFDSFHITICSRFHAHIFSILCKKPVLSIFSTRKVENLLAEIGTQYYYKMEVDSTNHPTHINSNILMNLFLRIESTYNEYVEKLDELVNLYKIESKNFKNNLDLLLFYLPRYLNSEEIDQLAYTKSRSIAEQIIKMTESNTYKMTTKNVVETISYELTGTRKSEYNYGLYSQINTPEYNLFESCKWILQHRYHSEKINNNLYKRIEMNCYCDNDTSYFFDNKKINMEFINYNILSGYHRSGWSYVIDGMKQLHNPLGVIFDSYLDKTFGWEHDFHTNNGTIPYTTDWIGVFHHTELEDYSDNNLVAVFNKNIFKKSLIHCKGIIVFSKKNRDWIVKKLDDLMYSIPVLSLIHPTEIVEKVFDYNLYKLNPCKKIFQIGSWLRNSYAIFDLPDVKNHIKFALKGKEMDNYFISNTDRIENNIKGMYNSGLELASGMPASDKTTNKYIIGLLKTIKDNHKSVIVLDNINNEQYDELLINNVVFINLVDASAVNTIIECIVRNVPIAVNRLSATEEYLGIKYPLFYDNLTEAHNLLSDPKVILKAHRYLKKLDKEKFTLDYFLKSLVDSELYRKL